MKALSLDQEASNAEPWRRHFLPANRFPHWKEGFHFGTLIKTWQPFDLLVRPAVLEISASRRRPR